MLGVSRSCFFALVLVAISGMTAADEIQTPTGAVVLTVDGAIGAKNADDRADFDLAMLQAMPATKFRTMTLWTEGTPEFEGVALADLFAAVGATGKSVHAVALNDYSVDIPIGDAVANGAIIAYRLNGKELAVREKGPLWIMYPFDDRPEWKTEIAYSHCVWQLRSLTVQ